MARSKMVFTDAIKQIKAEYPNLANIPTGEILSEMPVTDPGYDAPNPEPRVRELLSEINEKLVNHPKNILARRNNA